MDRNWRTGDKRGGFSFIELLTVLGIIGLLGWAASTALPSLLASRNLGDSANAVAQYLSLARSQALGQNTYVVTGFNDSVPGNLQLVGFRALNGVWNISGTAAFAPISPVVHLPNILLRTTGNLPANLQSAEATAGVTPDASTIYDDSTSTVTTTTSLPLTVPFSSGSFNQGVLIFTPEGDVLVAGATLPSNLSTQTYFRRIFLGLAGMPGGAGTSWNSATQSAALLIDGGSGKVTVYQP